jgi:hypothetical protein
MGMLAIPWPAWCRTALAARRHALPAGNACGHQRIS